ncbi:hypothetical protein DCD74_02295 [Lysobacter oculi]|uniref:Uncharacterized protein n=1 Tax=Solilutibacter oculi TaxID=2698682 RepID=A0A344J3R3_9GAMM|nr:hypothetical protein [Lysobacter oculi]AXA83673.1 hypothetical protein DCD74_02295 [Lysobacter oculi]
MSLAKFFDSIGAPLANTRWSWGAVRNDGAVALRVWQDGTARKDGKLLVQITHLEKYGDGRGRDNLGYAERLAHVELIRNGAKTYFVMCRAKDPSVHDAPRQIASFNDKEIFIGGPVLTIDGETWVEIVDRVPASAVA